MSEHADSPFLAMRDVGDSRATLHYRRRYRRVDTLISLLDTALAPFAAATKPHRIERFDRILFANYGHLGDVVMSTAALGIVREAFPRAKIGFLLGSWSRCVLEGHPAIDRLHVLDHWFMDRGSDSRFRKYPRYLKARRAVASEIAACRYDVAIDLRAWYPHAAGVLWLAQVPVRIGYAASGYGPLYTHPKRYAYARLHESVIQAELLRVLPIRDQFFENPPFSMPPPSIEGQRKVADLLGAGPVNDVRYSVLHVGASVAVRDWAVEKWRELAAQLISEGEVLLFTGHGIRDMRTIGQITLGLERCVNACNRLDWSGFVEAIRGARVVFSLETVAGHVAAAVGTPCVAIYGGMFDARQWAPRPGRNVLTVTQDVPCAICFRYNGCSHLSCLRKLGVEPVFRAGIRLLDQNANR